MKLEIINEDFEKAIALLEDCLFKSNFDNTDPESLKLLKLLEAREQNPKFEYDLAELICGEGQNNPPLRARLSYRLAQASRLCYLKKDFTFTS
jgi:hypothetical protein